MSQTSTNITPKYYQETCYNYMENSGFERYSGSFHSPLLHYHYVSTSLTMQIPAETLSQSHRLCFIRKERDSETGFSYFGARYYESDILTAWLSVDPMADKYPSLSPYAYCGWNPVRLVDPDGRDWYETENNETKQKEIKWTDYHSQEEMQKNGIDGKYLGLTYMDRQNSTYYSLYGGQIEYDKTKVSSMMAVNEVAMLDNLIINTVNGIKTTGNESRNFWEKHNYVINTFSNATSGMMGKLEGLKLLKRGFTGINVVCLTMSIQGHRNSFKKGTINFLNHISVVSSIIAFGGAYGATASLYLDGAMWAAKKGSETESKLKSYFSPLSKNNYFKKCYGF